MKLKYLLTVPLTISLAVLLTACTNPSNNVPIQSNSEYQNPPIDNPSITNTEALAIGAVGAATGYGLGKYANKPRYSKPSTVNGKPVVVVNKHYYQSGNSNTTRAKYKSTYRKRK